MQDWRWLTMHRFRAKIFAMNEFKTISRTLFDSEFLISTLLPDFHQVEVVFWEILFFFGFCFHFWIFLVFQYFWFLKFFVLCFCFLMMYFIFKLHINSSKMHLLQKILKNAASVYYWNNHLLQNSYKNYNQNKTMP